MDKKKPGDSPPAPPRPQPGVPGLVWGDPESCRTPQVPLLQGLDVCGFPLPPDLFWAHSARSQAGEGLTPWGGLGGRVVGGQAEAGWMI